MTDDGRALIRNAAPESAEIYRELESALGAERIATLLDALADMRDLLRQNAGEKTGGRN